VRTIGVLLCLFVPLVVSAQDTRGSISGTVTDSQAALVTGASVVVANTDTGTTTRLTTNGSGYYEALLLLPGSYSVTIELAGFKKAVRPSEKFDVVRGYLRLLGPATPRHVAEFLDAPLKDVQARWPEDVVEVTVGREKRSILAADEAALEADSPVTRLLGPYDLFLQARDRSTIVPDAAHAKELWPVLGRPGAVLVGGELVGSWRPRQSGKSLRVAVRPWRKLSAAVHKGVTEQAERLAAYRGVSLGGVDLA